MFLIYNKTLYNCPSTNDFSTIGNINETVVPASEIASAAVITAPLFITLFIPAPIPLKNFYFGPTS
jgi:hypothetical protein